MNGICPATGKRQRSRDQALRDLREMRADPHRSLLEQDRLNVYRCLACHRWHVGNKGLRRNPAA